MTRLVVVALASALSACGARSDFGEADRTAPIDLGPPDRLDAPAADDARFDAIWAASADEVWVGGKNDTYTPLLLQDVGGTWTGFYFDPAFGFGATMRIWGASSSAIWATAGSTILDWDGTSWGDAVDTTPAIVDLDGANEDDVWAVGAGIVLHRDDTGWSAMRPISETTAWMGVASDRSGGAWIVASEVVAHGDARGFTGAPTPVALVAPSIASSGPDDVWLVGNDASGRAFVGRGGGRQWTRIDVLLPPTASLVRVRSVARDDVWIVGDALLHWDGQGIHPVFCEGNPIEGRDVFVDASDVWVLGRCGAGADDVLHWRR